MFSDFRKPFLLETRPSVSTADSMVLEDIVDHSGAQPCLNDYATDNDAGSYDQSGKLFHDCPELFDKYV